MPKMITKPNVMVFTSPCKMIWPDVATLATGFYFDNIDQENWRGLLAARHWNDGWCVIRIPSSIRFGHTLADEVRYAFHDEEKRLTDEAV